MLSRSHSSLAEYTLLHLLYRGKEEQLARERPTVLALLSYHMIGLDEGINSLKQLSNQKVRLWVWAEDDILRRYDRTELVESIGTDCWITGRLDIHQGQCPIFEHVFIPVLSFSLITDLLSLNERRPFVQIILEALFTGKNVTALSIGSDPDHSVWRRKQWNQGAPLLRLEVNRKLERLRNMGIRIIHEPDATDIVQPLTIRNKRVLTEEHIVKAQMEGKTEMHISKTDLITPLAGDYAKAHGIRIIRE